MTRNPNTKRLGLAIALTLPVMVVCSSGVLHAQKITFPRPPQIKPITIPKMNSPINQRVWTCTGCGGVLGTGAFPPSTCPHCQARIINGVGPANKPINNTPVINVPQPVNNNPPVVVNNPPVDNPLVVNNPPVNEVNVGGGNGFNNNGPLVSTPPTNTKGKDSGGLSTGALIGAIVAGIVSLIGAGSMVFAGVLWFSSGSDTTPKQPRRRAV